MARDLRFAPAQGTRTIRELRFDRIGQEASLRVLEHVRDEPSRLTRTRPPQVDAGDRHIATFRDQQPSQRAQ